MKKIIQKISGALFLVALVFMVTSCDRDEVHSSIGKFSGILQKTDDGVTVKITSAREVSDSRGKVVIISYEATNNQIPSKPHGTIQFEIDDTQRVEYNTTAYILQNQFTTLKYTGEAEIVIPANRSFNYSTLEIDDIDMNR